MDQFARYLASRKPTVVREKYEDDPTLNIPDMKVFLNEQKPTILRENYAKGQIEEFSREITIPPLNTDIRFNKVLNTYTPTENDKNAMSYSHPDWLVCEDFNCLFNNPGAIFNPSQLVIAPLNTDINFQKLPVYGSALYDPSKYPKASDTHPKGLHEHDANSENFSWAISTTDDLELDLIKKKLIHPVSNQYTCGSCWAVSFAECMSDNFVVSGAVGWAPDISSTYVMSCVTTGNDNCKGGNPADVAMALESTRVADSSCIDYSWCINNENCSGDPRKHFNNTDDIGNILNRAIPDCGCYTSGVKKWTYKINPGSSTAFNISSKVPIDSFRNTVKAHLMDYGPTIGGFAVMSNFKTGNHANPKFNGGVYFDRADYNGYRSGALKFDDSFANDLQGLHAVSILGWGVAKNIQYDNGKTGDVPFWHCRNSWGTSWGDNGYFRMAMYPFNTMSQFDKTVRISRGQEIGGMIFIRATEFPLESTLGQIAAQYQTNIQKVKPASYYQATPAEISILNSQQIGDVTPPAPTPTPTPTPGVMPVNNRYLLIGAGVVMALLILFITLNR